MSVFQAQPGRQEQFLSSPADIVLYGGAAGGGKSYALLLECLRNVHNPGFGAIIFRKNMNQIFTEGSLWDTALSIYPQLGAVARKTPKPMFLFPSGAKVSFAHIERDEEVLGYQGAQIPLICFDELTHFSRYQFFYMLSRNRSVCGVKPYVRASCNPDASSFVAELISWWIDPDTGYPLEARAGQLRWFIRRDDVLHWAGSPHQLWEQFGLTTPEERQEPRSLTFIPAKLSDNRALMQKNPQYLANLKALPTVERERLLHGNWKILPAAGLYFQRARVSFARALPQEGMRWVRAWDLAATPENGRDEGDFTSGVLLGKRAGGGYLVADVINQRLDAEAVRRTILATARADRQRLGRVHIRLSQDPGQAGKDQAQQYVRLLAGFPVSAVRETGSKLVRAEPFAAQWQQGNVQLLEAPWNDAYLCQLESFPEGRRKDMVDASANAFSQLELGSGALPLSAGAGKATRLSPWRL